MRIPPILNVHRHDTDNRTLVTLAGEIDLTSAPLVHASLERCLHDGIRVIDVDVTAVTFCDCSGLNAFLHALLHTAAGGGRLRLHHPSPALERLVALTGSGSLFLTLPDALAGSRQPHTRSPPPCPMPRTGSLRRCPPFRAVCCDCPEHPEAPEVPEQPSSRWVRHAAPPPPEAALYALDAHWRAANYLDLESVTTIAAQPSGTTSLCGKPMV
jgi:anti-sigma B factor antagonist